MENASKALLMAAGMLIGILILALMAVLFIAGSKVFTGYEETKTSEMVQSFNNNFIKYVGQDLTAHQVVTICNFATNNTIHKVTIDGPKDISTIKSDVSTPLTIEEYSDIENYTLEIISYTKEGYVDKIKIN